MAMFRNEINYFDTSLLVVDDSIIGDVCKIL